MVRNLRIVAASFCLVVSLALTALWVRSYSYGDHLDGSPVLVFSWWGQLHVGFRTAAASSGRGAKWWSTLSVSKAILEKKIPGRSTWPEPSLIEFDVRSDRWSDPLIVFPHWFPMMVAAALAVILKPRPRLRFSLREALVLMTVAAAMLGGSMIFLRVNRGW